MEAHDAPTGLTRRVVSAFVLLTLAVLGTGGLPRFVDAQDTVQEWTDPAIVGAGLWQARWELYAPSPHGRNVAIVGIVQFEDDVRVEWRSPDWRALTWRGKSRYFRHAEYVDAVRRSWNVGLRAPLARYLARTAPHPSGDPIPPVRVELWRHWVKIPEPTEPLRPFDDPFPLDSKRRFHVERLD